MKVSNSSLYLRIASTELLYLLAYECNIEHLFGHLFHHAIEVE